MRLICWLLGHRWGHGPSMEYIDDYRYRLVWTCERCCKRRYKSTLDVRDRVTL